jgi:AsmA family protein
VLKLTAIALALLIGSAALFVALFDWNLLRDRAARMASERLEREVTIEALDVRLGAHPSVRLTGLRIANPEWASTPTLLQAERVAITTSFWTLIRGRLILEDVEVVGPRVALEQRGDDRTWVFARATEPRAPPLIQRLAIVDGALTLRDAGRQTALDARFETRNTSGQLVVGVRGTYRGEPVRGEATGPPLLLLAGDARPYPLRAKLMIGGTTARVAGTITGLATLEALDLDVEMSGQNLADLERFLAINAPRTPPYRLAGHLRRAGAEWRLEPLRGAVGDSDIAGSASYRARRPRPLVRADLVSERLDFDDLGPLIGLPPKTGPGETASPQQRREARRLQRAKQVLPDQPFRVANWDRFDADVRWIGRRVLRAPALPIDALDGRVRLENAVLRLEPLQLDIAGGQIVANVALRGAREPPQGNVQVEFRNLQLPKLFPTVPAMRQARGALHGRAELAGQGNSVARLVGSAQGRATLAIADGTISNLVLELIGLDAGEALRLFATGDRRIPLHCGILDLDVRNGVATTKALVLDTADTLVVGAGVVDLRQELLDLTVYPRPKDASLFSARSPLRVDGRWRDPVVRPDPGSLAVRGVGAVLLGMVNPLLALLPLIETGPGGDSDCARLVAQAREWTKSAGPDAQRAPPATRRMRP